MELLTLQEFTLGERSAKSVSGQKEYNYLPRIWQVPVATSFPQVIGLSATFNM